MPIQTKSETTSPTDSTNQLPTTKTQTTSSLETPPLTSNKQDHQEEEQVLLPEALLSTGETTTLYRKDMLEVVLVKVGPLLTTKTGLTTELITLLLTKTPLLLGKMLTVMQTLIYILRKVYLTLLVTLGVKLTDKMPFLTRL